MTNQLLDQIAKQFSLDRSCLSCALLGGGVNRSPKSAKNILLVFSASQPLCVVKWYTEQNPLLEIEGQQLAILNKVFPLAPQFIGSFECNNRPVVMESFLDGASLEDLLCKKFISPDQALTHARTVFDTLFYKTSSPSSDEKLKGEVEELLAELEIVNYENKKWVSDTLLGNLDAFKSNQGVRSSLVHFDFIPRNIILVGEVAHLFDFEFSEPSHLAICDWFRFFMYSPGLMQQRIFAPGLVSELVLEQPLPDVFSQTKLGIQHVAAISIATYLIDFKLQRAVAPDYTVSALAESLKAQLDTVARIIQVV